ncbi:glycosyltransferase [Caulobacter sp. DWR1-3-2b1]|uniref:glycosyltransferase n=1 Tax=Caulobacter sp. DWR1-3-2b1 TaxID=2804670 RepID=UPI003CF03C05
MIKVSDKAPTASKEAADGAPRLQPAPVDVCICTFHRPEVIETLRSVAAQTRLPSRVIVVDNAEEPEAAGRVSAEAALLGLTVVYIHAPARNISLARNAALNAARAPWLAFIDDDQFASPNWLSALLDRAADGDVDAVLGPVDAIYDPAAPVWLRRLNSHSTRPVFVGGKILKGYAGNVLLKRSTLEATDLSFDLALGRTGGEDDRFFLQMTGRGGRIGFAPNAVVYEPVPEARTRWGWLLKRNFRSGQTHGAHLAQGGSRGQRLRHGLVAATKALACAGCALASFPDPARRAGWVLRGAMHLGAASRLAGRRELELY